MLRILTVMVLTGEDYDDARYVAALKGSLVRLPLRRNGRSHVRPRASLTRR